MLIVNGFDLAHGMETSYRQFIDSYWEECITEIHNLAVNIKYENDEIIIESRPIEKIPTDSYEKFSKALEDHNKKILFKNKFFEIITKNRNYKKG